MIKIDAVAASAAPAPAPSATPPARLALRPAPAAAARPRQAPSFDLGAPAAPASVSAAAPAAASARATSAAPTSARTSARSSARPPANLALPALDAGRPARDPGADPAPSRVAARDPEPTGGGRSRTQDPKLRGVALGSLASCVSDKQEDTLKQQLVSLVGEPGECQSEAGRYRFVETRNSECLSHVGRACPRATGGRPLRGAHACARLRPEARG